MFVPGPSVVASGRVCALIEGVLRQAQARAIRETGRCDPEVGRFVSEVGRAAEAYRFGPTSAATSAPAEVEVEADTMGTMDIAQRSGVGDRAVRLAVKRGELPGVLVRGAYRIPAREAHRFIAERKESRRSAA